MAEQDKTKWWSSLPGMLTAATGFVAALSGLVAGLGQLGVFDRREAAAPQEVASAPAPIRAEAEEHTAAGDSARADSPPATVRASPGPAPAPRPAREASPVTIAPTAVSPAPRPAPAPAPAPADTIGRDSTSGQPTDTSVPAAADTVGQSPRPAGVLRAGTVLELITAARVCAPDSGMRRLTARTAAPVRTGGVMVMPRGTGAVLHLGRGTTAGTVVVRLDSLLLSDTPLAVARSTARVRRGSVTGACLKPSSRVTVTIGAPVSVPGS